MPRGLSDSNCHPRCAMPMLWVLLGGRSASLAFGNPEQHPGTARGRLGAGFEFLLRSYLSLVAAVQSQVEVHPGLQNSHSVPPG